MIYFLSLLTRCKDEPFVDEFVEYYLKEGVEHIYIIDDNSTLEYSDKIKNHPQVTIYFEQDIINRNIANQIYHAIKNETQWLIYVDVDEYIVPKKNPQLTIKEQLVQDFDDVDCVKIPWVMMSANGREKNPQSLFKETIYRWNHDLKHINTTSKEHKFRCRYDAIEIKSIFRVANFVNIWDHHPTQSIDLVRCVDGVHKKNALLDPFYPNLREKDIQDAYFVCYHYRILSIENSLSKIQNNIWYQKYTLDDLMSSDYAEVVDETLKNRVLKQNEN